MNDPNLQTTSLEQYVQVQGSENDPIYQKFREQEQKILDHYHDLLHNSKEYQNYVEAKEKKAETIWDKFKENLNEQRWNEVDEIKRSFIEERKILLDKVDPNHEIFNQSYCGKIIKKENNHNCAVLNCVTNEKFLVMINISFIHEIIRSNGPTRTIKTKFCTTNTT